LVKTIKTSAVAQALTGILLILSFILSFSGSAPAKVQPTWISFSPAAQKALSLNVTGSDFHQITFDIQVPGLWLEALTTESGNFSLLSLVDAGVSTVIGQPNLPVITKMVQIPFGAEVSLSLESFRMEEKSLSELGMANRIAPVQPPLPKIQDAQKQVAFAIDEKAYQRDAFLPTQRVKLGPIGVIRGHRYATVYIYPLSYNPQKGAVRIYQEMKVKVTLEGADMAQTQSQLHRYASPPFEKLSAESFINYPTYAPLSKDAPSLPMGYLIITHPNFSLSLIPLVEWKTRKGFQVTVASVSDIGSDAASIKAYIQDAYDNWEIPPTYVLFVGDMEYIPAWAGTYSGSAPTDLYYVKMDSDDFADIFRGRLPAKSLTEAGTMISKIMYYENPGNTDLEWMGKVCFVAASDLGGFAEETHDYVMANYLFPNGIVCDSIWESMGGTGSMITSSVNDGRAILCYSGHGSEYSWSSVYYNQTNIRDLNNPEEYPFVLSHACLTGKFSVSECFGETWAKVSGKGASAFWGASNLTYWNEDDLLEKRMFEAAFVETCYSIGNMTDRALMELYQYYGGTGRSRYYLDVYNLLGDPSLNLWTHPAESLFVELPSFIDQELNTVDIVIRDGENQPLSGALVCLYKETEVFQTGYTDIAGQVTLYPFPLNPGEVMVTVTAHNFLPFEGWIEVLPEVGDLTKDGSIELGDVIFLLNYLFKSGPVPDPFSVGDVNCDGGVELSDAIYLLNYLFRSGPAPCTQ
jgi:hypothetical protein